MRLHKTSPGRMTAGMGLVLCCATLGPQMDPGPAVALAPAVFDVDVEDTALVSSAGRGFAPAAVSAWPASDVLRTACSLFTCASLDVSQNIDMQGMDSTAMALALSGNESAMPSSAANGDIQGVAPGRVAPGSTAGAMPGSDLLHRPAGGLMPLSRPADRDPQSIAPILAVLDDSDRPLEPALTEPVPAVVAASNDPAPTALLPDADAPAAAGPIGSPALLAAAPVGSSGGPVNGGRHPFDAPSGRMSPPAVPSVSPMTGPAPMAEAPDRGPAVAVPLRVPVVNDGSHPVPPGAIPDHPIDLLDIGRGRDSETLPRFEVTPFDHLFDGPDRTPEGIAGAAPSPAGKQPYPFIDPSSDTPAFTPTDLVAADAPEPSMLALLALAALGLALTRGSLHRTGTRAS